MLTQLEPKAAEPIVFPAASQSNDNGSELDAMLAGYTKMDVTPPPQPTPTETLQKLTFSNKPRKERADKGRKRNEPYVAPASQPTGPHPAMGTVPGQAPVQRQMINSEIISGALFLLLIDMLLPMVIVTLNGLIGKHPIDIEKLQLSDKQKKDLEPIAERAMKQAAVQLDPVWTLVLSMCGIYGMNFYHLKRQAEIKAKREGK